MDVIVYPLSGYVNRLQAVASAALVAGELGANLRILWEPTAVAPAPASLVFDPRFVTQYVLDFSDAHDVLQVNPSSIPVGLTVDLGARRISLRGHLVGEQHFMPQLRYALAAHPEVEQLVFVAGGKFWLDGGERLESRSALDFRDHRAQFYRNLRLHPDVERPALSHVEAHRPYLALHLRYTDRNHQAPTRRQIRAALRELRANTGIQELFVASDLAEERERWHGIGRELGFKPWSVVGGTLERGDARGAHAALIDWRVLGCAEALVYFGESSFAEEAAVASGHFENSIALSPSCTRALAVGALEWFGAAVTYPKRHLRR